jgi:hypothetical protein
VHNGKLSAEKSEMPGFIKPQLAIPSKPGRPRADDRWLHEIKFDDYLAQFPLNKVRRKVYARNGLSRSTVRFSTSMNSVALVGKSRRDRLLGGRATRSFQISRGEHLLMLPSP